MSIKIVSDIHSKDKEPYRTATLNLLNWLVEYYSQDTIIFAGDLFDKSSPHNDIISEVVERIKKLYNVIIVTGNHDISKSKGNALTPLKHHSNIKIITSPTDMIIDGISFKFMPHKLSSMADYEEMTGNYNYIVTHTTPKGGSLFSKGIEYKMYGTYFHGHEHIPFEFIDTYGNTHIGMGVPSPTRHLEDDHLHVIYSILDSKNYIGVNVPQTFEYETIEFGEEPTNNQNILNVLNAPSIKSVYDTYKTSYIRNSGITVLRHDLDQSEYVIDSLDIAKSFLGFAEGGELHKEIFDRAMPYLENIKYRGVYED